MDIFKTTGESTERGSSLKRAQIIDPSNTLMFTGSQLTHALQLLESMEKAGITDQEFLATTLIHDLASLPGLSMVLSDHGCAWVENRCRFVNEPLTRRAINLTGRARARYRQAATYRALARRAQTA